MQKQDIESDQISVPHVSSLDEIHTVGVNDPPQYFVSPKHPMSTSTNKMRKAKKAKRQNKKAGRKRNG